MNRSLRYAKLSKDEQSQIVDDLLALKKTKIWDFLDRFRVPKLSTKAKIRDRLVKCLEDNSVDVDSLIAFLDEVVPWGKQHIFLYKGPISSIDKWKDVKWLGKKLEKCGLAGIVNSRLPLVLPKEMKVSSVEHTSERMRVTAIRRRDWWDRNEEYDEAKTVRDGVELDLRAYVHRITRSLVAFEWDLVANTAFLQITQLPSKVLYEDVEKEFFELVGEWLDGSMYAPVDLRPAIKHLHKLERQPDPETRSYGRSYRSLEGRTLDVRSSSKDQAVLGEQDLDTALDVMTENGLPRIGNFYWLPRPALPSGVKPLDQEIHVVVVGTKHRINFPKANVEAHLRYVLSRIRSHC